MLLVVAGRLVEVTRLVAVGGLAVVAAGDLTVVAAGDLTVVAAGDLSVVAVVALVVVDWTDAVAVVGVAIDATLTVLAVLLGSGRLIIVVLGRTGMGLGAPTTRLLSEPQRLARKHWLTAMAMPLSSGPVMPSSATHCA